MPANYVLLERITLSATAASIVLDNIPQTGYTDLKIVASVRSDYVGQAIALRINPNNSGANMIAKVLLGSGTSASSFNDTIAYASSNASTSTAGVYNSVEWYIPNYTLTNNKSISTDFVTETNATAAIMGLSSGLWQTTTAINSVTILVTSGNLLAGSSISVYGIAAVGVTPVIAPKASGGDVIVQDGTYWYHAFLTSGTLTTSQAFSCDVLTIAGGGGGQSGGSGGGGGAGGIFYATSQALLSSTNYACTVGAGGGTDTPGSNSQFGTLTVGVGGGRGGDGSQTLNGGSGGGGYPGVTGGASTQTSTGGTGYGNAGGNGGAFVSPYSSGGGGGAGAAGTAGNSGANQSGAGGAGLNTWSSWASATGTGASGFYAGGGGGAGNQQYGGAGGAGGSGGGGAGGTSGGTGTAGTANTGGGGGGSSKQPSGAGTGSAGGSGIVIVRYTMA